MDRASQRLGITLMLLSAAALMLVAGCTAAGGVQATTTSRPRPLSALAGMLITAGSGPGQANLFRVAGDGTLRPLTHFHTRGIGVDSFTSNSTTIVVSDDRVGYTDRVEALRKGKFTDLKLGHSFTPGLSPTGALAWMTLRDNPTTFVTVVRKRGDGRKAVFSSTDSAEDPTWIGPETLLVASRNSAGTQLTITKVQLGQPVTTRTIATIHARRPDFSANSHYIAIGHTLLTAAGRKLPDLATGWTPLCWRSTNSLVVDSGPKLGITHLVDDHAGPVRTLGQVAKGLGIFEGSCTTPFI